MCYVLANRHTSFWNWGHKYKHIETVYFLTRITDQIRMFNIVWNFKDALICLLILTFKMLLLFCIHLALILPIYRKRLNDSCNSAIKLDFLMQNNLKSLEPSFKTGLDLWDCSRREISCLITERNTVGRLQRNIFSGYCCPKDLN